MSFVTHFVPVNAVRFYPEQNALPANINTPPFAWKPWAESLQLWQSKKNYYIPAYNDDICTIMVHTQANDEETVVNPPVLEVWLRNTDTVLDTDTGYRGTVINANNVDVDPITGDVTPLYCTCWSFSWSTLTGGLAVNSGDYYFKIINYGLDGVSNVVYLSEYVRVYDNQPETVLLSAQYNTNRQNVIIDGWDGGYDPVFYHRVEGSIRRLELEGYQQTYLQQNYNQKATHTANWRQFALRVGYKNGIPEYTLERLTYALTSDIVTIDGVYYQRKGEGSTNPTGMWQITRQDPDPLFSAECKLVEYTNSVGDVFRVSPVTIFTMPDDGGSIRYPFAYNYILMTQGGVSSTEADAGAIYDSTDLTNLITYLNDTFAPANGMVGTFGVSGLNIVYYRGLGETWIAGSGMVVFGRYMAFQMKSTGALHNHFSYIMNKTAGGSLWKSVIDYGDGTVEYRFSATSETRQHGLAVGLFDVYIFHTGEDCTGTNSIGSLRVGYYGDDAYYINIITGSTAPTELTFVFIPITNNTGNVSNIDTSFLQTCASTLTDITIGGAIDSFADNVFDGGATFTGPIVNYGFDCSLSSAGVDALVNSIVSWCDLATGSPGAVLYIPQNPPAPPISSAAQIATLEGAPTNWTVTHD